MGTPLQKRSQVAAGAGGWGGESNITRSAWFDGSADYLEKSAPGASASNLKECIVGAWFRQAEEPASDVVLVGADTSSNAFLHFRQNIDANGAFEVVSNNPTTILQYYFDAAREIRDTEWYHVLFSIDTSQGVSADRVKAWLNGVEMTANITTSVTPNTDLIFGGNHPYQVNHFGYANTQTFTGKLAQVFCVQGLSIQQGDYAITDFGQSITVGTNGSIWAPVSDSDIKTAVDAGDSNNSFLLSSAIGDGTDDSANENDFLPTSMSDLTNGSDDTPSTPLPIFNTLFPGGGNVFTEEGGAVGGSADGSQANQLVVTPGFYSGQHVLEFECTNQVSDYPGIGLIDAATIRDGAIQSIGTSNALGNSGMPGSYGYGASGRLDHESVNIDGSVASFTTNDRIAIEVDLDSDVIRWYKNGSLQSTTNTAGLEAPVFFAIDAFNGADARIIAQVADMTHAPTTGYTPPQIRNFEAPPTVQGVDLFNVAEYAGSGPSSQSITGLGFQPDFIWFKARNISYNHTQYDSSRPITKNWFSSALAAEGTDATGLTSYDSDGFSLGSKLGVNDGNYNFVAWCWKVNGGTTAVNNDGDIESTVQLGEFMSIVTYLGNATASQTIGHGLGAPPDMIITKNRDASTAALVWFNSFSAQYLNLTNGSAVSAGVYGTTMNSTVFEVESNSEVNGSSQNMIAYCFKNVPGVCQIDRYGGNGNADGAFIYTGFRPRFIFIKGNVSPQEWLLYDTVRQTFNDGSTLFFQHDSSADVEGTDFKDVDILANGFKLRDTTPTHNQSGVDYYYMAIADVASGTGLPPIPGR